MLTPATTDILIKTLAKGGILDCKTDSIVLMASTKKVKWERSADALTIKMPETLSGDIVNGFKISTQSSFK